MRTKALFLHFLLAGVVSGYLAALSLFLLYQTLTLPTALVAALAILPFYCIFTFPAAMLLTGIFYTVRRTANQCHGSVTEFVVFSLFTALTAIAGFGVGSLVRFNFAEPFRDLLNVGTAVGAVIGIAEYFVWRHSLEPPTSLNGALYSKRSGDR